MTKQIITALITAFLIFLASAIYNAASHGGLIRLLGGITREELRQGITVQIRDEVTGDDVMGRGSKDQSGEHPGDIVHVQPNGQGLHQVWVIKANIRQ